MNRTARYITYGSAVIATAGIVACGGDNDRADRNGPTASTTTTAATPYALPSCSVLWRKGRDVPRDYSGCVLPDGSESAAMIVECNDGRSWVVHNDQFFGYLGGTIAEAPADSNEYREAYERCLMGKE